MLSIAAKLEFCAALIPDVLNTSGCVDAEGAASGCSTGSGTAGRQRHCGRHQPRGPHGGGPAVQGSRGADARLRSVACDAAAATDAAPDAHGAPAPCGVGPGERCTGGAAPGPRRHGTPRRGCVGVGATVRACHFAMADAVCLWCRTFQEEQRVRAATLLITAGQSVAAANHKYSYSCCTCTAHRRRRQPTDARESCLRYQFSWLRA